MVGEALLPGSLLTRILVFLGANKVGRSSSKPDVLRNRGATEIVWDREAANAAPLRKLFNIKCSGRRVAAAAARRQSSWSAGALRRGD
jgi:hypothetical protein